ncbi:type III secretion system cytoplasmic ring protein SctQ [Candidatus Neptunochlamydia vexilliferae]|uniref:Flagellar motor switch protein FliN-like C-terminal domain-containing protein n=1 Tax=Candidatus Neptunichlamydia vexilliferae TaxID=1651774 RepID=A0ABS0B127_9BACT|nr:type III secretion system cytoplasmic ring protein SctQ [Candidatus Neptunochlamydia vexilliferae]MBF5059376.1 hypothetical protein [Candidatus Neptunochlamydia vexilliferae]
MVKHWIKHVESLAAGAQEVPMWGAVPSFPWETFAEHLSASLGTKALKITAGTSEWKQPDALLAGMGHAPLQMAVELSPLQGNAFLIFSSEDFSKLSSWAIHPEAGNEGFADPYLQKGFFRYLTTESLAIVDRMQVFQGLAPKLVEAPLAGEEAYAVEIEVEHEGETVRGRLICPRVFQQTFKGHFAADWNFSIPSHLYEETFVNLSLAAGETKLSQETWGKLEEGDFLLLDHCSYYPALKKGTFQLCLEGSPLFQTKIKEENLKLLDYAHYFEDNTMDDDEFEAPFEEPLEEEVPPPEAVSVEDPPQEKMVSPKKVPIALTVEVAKMKISLDKLLKLKPGNILELGVQPEKGVDLVANGKCVGKGELLQVGDVIGVKIVKLGG